MTSTGRIDENESGVASEPLRRNRDFVLLWSANFTSTLPLPAIPTTNQKFPVQLPDRKPHTR